MALTPDQSKMIDDMIAEADANRAHLEKVRRMRSTEGRVIRIEVDAEYTDEFGAENRTTLTVGGLHRCQVNEVVSLIQRGFAVTVVRVYDQEDAELVETMTDYD